MYARVTEFTMQPDKIDDAGRISDTEIVPGMHEDSGYRSIHVLVDRNTGKAMVITIWESQADEEASRAKVGQRFGMLRETLSGAPGEPKIYEVLTSDVAMQSAT